MEECYISIDDLPTPLAGIDEAGRGCLAGPVVAAAVIFPDKYFLPGLTDSKKLTSSKRKDLEKKIKNKALSWSLGLAWPREIEKINIHQATMLAMCRAIKKLQLKPAFLCIDGVHTLPLSSFAQKCIKHGDFLIPQISAASIIAKTFRDHLMFRLARRYPGYGFIQNKGYGTKFHIKSLQRLGPCSIHRFTFKPISDLIVERQLCLPGT